MNDKTQRIVRSVELPYMYHEKSMIDTLRTDIEKYGVTIEVVAFNGAAGWPTVRAHGIIGRVEAWLRYEYGSNVDFDNEKEVVEFWRDHIDYAFGRPPTKDWPTVDSPLYDEVVEVSIGLITAGGHTCDDLDKFGDEAGDVLQYDLMDAMFRSEGLRRILGDTYEIAQRSAINAIAQFNRENNR